MLHTFYRQDLFDLVWSEPTRTIAKRLGISDVGLAKACRRAELLLPPRGYWAKLVAGKTVKRPQQPRRGPGMSDRIVLGRDRWSWGPDPVDLSTPDPPPPTFLETLEELAGRLGEIEPAVQRVLIVLRVLQPCQARTDETCELVRIGRFLRENVSRTREAIKR